MTRRDIIETFSVSRVAVIDGRIDSTALYGELYGVRSATLELDYTTYENIVDGVVQSNWSIFKKAKLQVTGGFLPLQLLNVLNNSLVSEKNTGLHAPLWEERQQFTPEVSLLLTVPSRTAQGAQAPLHIVLYRVQFEPITLPSFAYKSGGVVNYTATALMSNLTETGSQVKDSKTDLPAMSIGRIFSENADSNSGWPGGVAPYGSGI